MLIETTSEVDPQLPGDEFEVHARALFDDMWKLACDRARALQLGPSDTTAMISIAAGQAYVRALAVGMTASSVRHGVLLARALPMPEELVAVAQNTDRLRLVARAVLSELQGAVAARPIA
jgi:hypothetical protein